MNKHFSSFAAIILVAICYAVARLPTLPSSEIAALAGRFSFKKLALPEVADHPPYKLVRQVHPSLERISAWVSSLGAAAALADLDRDGLPNDLIYVDPRTTLSLLLRCRAPVNDTNPSPWIHRIGLDRPMILPPSPRWAHSLATSTRMACLISWSISGTNPGALFA
jgi:hypothetical protein